MGLKGINPFEQHVEKMVVGISGAALLVVLALQFMGGSSAVKVGKGPPVPPADAFKPVEQEAERLAARLDSGQPELPSANKTEILSLFESKLTAPVAPRPGIASLGPSPAVTQMAVGSEQPVDTPLAAVTVPAPGEPVAYAFRSTISPFEWFGVEDLRKHLPAQQPFDKAAVSVEATFDGTALKKALTEDPDGDAGPARPLPLTWWRDGVEIVGVELEREQRGPDGSWGAATVVRGLPGRPDLIGEVPQTLKGIGDVNPFLARVRSASEAVQRPAYYETIAGPKWTSPVEASAMGEEGLNQGPDSLVQKIAKLDTALADLETKMSGLPTSPPAKDPKEPPPSRGPRGGGGEGGGGKGGGGGGGGRQGPQGPSPQQTALRDYLKWQALNKQFTARQNERTALVGQLAKQGLDPLGQPMAAAQGQPGEVVQPLMDNPAVKVWGHDITVEPGAMYRYRTRVVVNNPMFGRRDALLEEQKPMAEEPLVRGQWSEWGSPVQVDANGYFFIVSASEQDAVAGKRATAELYQFYYGYWRKGAVNVEPGDPLLAEAKLPAELPIFDLTKLATLPPPAASNPGRGRDGGDGGDGGGGRGVAPGGDEGGGRGRVSAPPEPSPATAAASKDAPPAGVTFAPAKMAVGVDALFLDVAPVPSIGDRRLATGGGQLQAFLRDPAGQIITRIPDHDRRAEAYRRVAESARAGETQGKPVVKPVEGPSLPPPPTRPQGERPPPGGGGGGGGGG